MIELTAAERQEIIEHTKRFAATMKTHCNGRYEFKAKQPNFSSVNFSADIEDVGNEEFSFMNDAEFNFAAYNQAAKQQAAFSQLKKLTLTHSIKDNLKEWILKKNNISKRNRAAKLEAQKAFDNR